VVIAEADPIPDDLREAFQTAVSAYSDWTRGGPEPQIDLKAEPWTIGSICRQVDKFKEPMPPKIYDYLSIEVDRHLPDNLIENSYGSGAKLLGRLIDAKNERYRAKSPLLDPETP
jgi:hypothetical protein